MKTIELYGIGVFNIRKCNIPQQWIKGVILETYGKQDKPLQYLKENYKIFKIK